MKQDNIYEKLKDLLSKSGGGYSILEEQIDIELQVDFYQMANKLMKKKRVFADIVADSEKLYDSKVSNEIKKRILAELSNEEKVEAYRIIEKYTTSAKKNLKQWAMLALQHCRIGLETHLLDEKQIFISTGLGGKENRLRYFIVVKLKSEGKFTNTQKKVIQSELDFSFKTNNSVIEKIDYFDDYYTVIGLLPIDKSINEVVRNAIHESNNYGGFLHEDFLVTNVKILKPKEIMYYFKKKGIE